MVEKHRIFPSDDPENTDWIAFELFCLFVVPFIMILIFIGSAIYSQTTFRDAFSIDSIEMKTIEEHEIIKDERIISTYFATHPWNIVFFPIICFIITILTYNFTYYFEEYKNRPKKPARKSMLEIMEEKYT